MPDDYQSQGIGSKLMEGVLDLAENWLNLKRIELTVYTDNEPAIHLYKKYGFAIEGTFHNYALREGSYVDAHAMAKVIGAINLVLILVEADRQRLQAYKTLN